MKDVSSTSTRNARNQLYPKKRPSPHRDAIQKHRGASSPNSVPRRTPTSIKVRLHFVRQRETQLLAYRMEGIFIEEEYRDEICAYMHTMELYTMSSASAMDQQPEIRWHMRPCLVEFIIEIHFTFRLRPETLYLALNIVDRYVSRRIVYTKHYQLVGCAALWIAAKFEDAKERVPTVTDLVQICRETYDESAFIQMEGHVLATIQWTLGHPTAEAWMRFYCCGSYEESARVQHVARFLMEITLFYRDFIKFCPSAIALASLILARHVCQEPRRIYDEPADVIEVVELLDQRLSRSVSDLSETLVKKYSFPFYSKASTHTVQWYLTGNRFVRNVLPCLIPATPVSSRNPLSALSTPMSSMSVSTDSSSDDVDMPITPTSPAYAVDPFLPSQNVVSTQNDKENVPAIYDSSVSTKYSNAADDCPSQDYYSRPVLHDRNVLAPSPVRQVS
ncbi:cyclin-like protein [Phellopilus nigrolimitatus]|nr:cyclin-like protein [Phellopilus nigrolimitatus]